MATSNEKIFDAAVRHQVNLQRLSKGEANKIIAMLEKSDKELIALINKRAEGLSTDFTTQRWQAMRKEIARTRSAVIRSIGGEIGNTMQDLAVLEQDIAKASLLKAVPVEVNFATTNPTTLRALAQDSPFGGANTVQTLTEWMTNLEDVDQSRITGALQAGIQNGETIPQINRRVQQATGLTQQNAEAISRTGVNHISNASREEFFKENDDVILALRWVSTLDGRTSAICRARDGHFALPEGSSRETVPSPAIQGSPLRPPAHLRCRSLMVAVLDSDGVADGLPERPFVRDSRTGRQRELDFRKDARKQAGDDWKGMGREERNEAIRDVRRKWAKENVGQVPGETTYDEWLRRQDKEFQNEVLGPTKAKKFREGLEMEQFVDRSGNELTIAQLKDKTPPANKLSTADRDISKARDLDAKAKRAEERAAKAKVRENAARESRAKAEADAKRLRKEQAELKEADRKAAADRKAEQEAKAKAGRAKKAAEAKAKREAAVERKRVKDEKDAAVKTKKEERAAKAKAAAEKNKAAQEAKAKAEEKAKAAKEKARLSAAEKRKAQEAKAKAEEKAKAAAEKKRVAAEKAKAAEKKAAKAEAEEKAAQKRQKAADAKLKAEKKAEQKAAKERAEAKRKEEVAKRTKEEQAKAVAEDKKKKAELAAKEKKAAAAEKKRVAAEKAAAEKKRAEEATAAAEKKAGLAKIKADKAEQERLLTKARAEEAEIRKRNEEREAARQNRIAEAKAEGLADKATRDKAAKSAAKGKGEFADLQEAPNVTDSLVDQTNNRQQAAVSMELRKAEHRLKLGDTRPIPAKMGEKALTDPKFGMRVLSPEQQNVLYGKERATLMRRMSPDQQGEVVDRFGRLRSVDELMEEFPRDIPQTGSKWNPGEQDKWANSVTSDEVHALRRWTQDQDEIQTLQGLTPAQRAALPKTKTFDGKPGRTIEIDTVGGQTRSQIVREGLLENWESALAKAPDYDGEVWRGIGLDKSDLKKMIKGGVIKLADDQSASVISTQAWDFAEAFGGRAGKHGVMFRIRKQTSGKMIMDHALFDEAEVVLRKGTSYRIVKVVEEGRMTILEMEEI